MTVREQKGAIDARSALTDIREKLAFLMSLKGADIQALAPDGAAASAVRADAELERLVERISTLAARVDRSLSSVDSEAMAAALAGYATRHSAAAGRVAASSPEWIAGAVVGDGSAATRP